MDLWMNGYALNPAVACGGRSCRSRG
jgi:hypothetical protein